MKSTLIILISLIVSPLSYAVDMSANELFEIGIKYKQVSVIRTNKKKEVGGLIQRHPLLSHARRLFSEGGKLPLENELAQGKTWTCLQFSGLDFQTDIIEITKTRTLSFESYGAGIIKEVSYGNNQIKLYASDNGELAGINPAGELYEAIRLTSSGDLILESSIQGLGWWKNFFMSLIGGGRSLSKLLKIVQKTMITSVSNTEGGGLVFDYTVCPKIKIIDGVTLF